MFESGDIVLAQIQYADSFEVKKRPAVVLFEELSNIVVAGITSNKNMQGIKLAQSEGAVKDSVIKLNYIFTITEKAVTKKLFKLNQQKRLELFEEMQKRISLLKSQ